MLISMLALVVHVYYRAYIDARTDQLQFGALTVLALTLFVGLLLKGQEGEEGGAFENIILSVFLIGMNALILLLALILLTYSIYTGCTGAKDSVTDLVVRSKQDEIELDDLELDEKQLEKLREREMTAEIPRIAKEEIDITDDIIEKNSKVQLPE